MGTDWEWNSTKKKNLPELSKQALSKIKTTRRNPKKIHKIFNYFFEPVLIWVVLDRFIRLDQLIKVRINNMEQTWSQLISQCWLNRFTPSSAGLFKLSKFFSRCFVSYPHPALAPLGNAGNWRRFCATPTNYRGRFRQNPAKKVSFQIAVPGCFESDRFVVVSG